MKRRSFSLALSAVLCAPALPRRARASYGEALSRLPQMNSLMIQRGDDLIVAEARRPGGLEQAANIKSCSKSLVALLLGAAVQRGEISLDECLGDIVPQLIPSGATDGVEDITIADLVTLRAGLAGTSGGNYGAWVSSPNWIAYVLRQPMLDRPGGRMIYSTGTTHLLGAVLAETTGVTLLEQARQRIGRPMGIDIPAWTADPQGYYFGGNEMSLTPRAMLEIALMIRDEGRFNGQQVVATDWISASMQPRTRSPFSGMSYGYGWFLSDQGYVLARGYGGQVIAAHPKTGLAVAITSDPTQPARSTGYFGDIMSLLNEIASSA